MERYRFFVAHTCGTTTRVDNNVYIGGYLAAADLSHIKRQKITHILKLFSDDQTYAGGYHRHPGIEYLVIDAEDRPDYPLDKHFVDCLKFIQKAIREQGRILVHCHAGISRSATIVLLHLMINTGLSLNKAWAHLKQARPVINPNLGFWGLLKDIHRRTIYLRMGRHVRTRPNHTPLLFQKSFLTSLPEESE